MGTGTASHGRQKFLVRVESTLPHASPMVTLIVYVQIKCCKYFSASAIIRKNKLRRLSIHCALSIFANDFMNLLLRSSEQSNFRRSFYTCRSSPLKFLLCVRSSCRRKVLRFGSKPFCATEFIRSQLSADCRLLSLSFSSSLASYLESNLESLQTVNFKPSRHFKAAKRFKRSATLSAIIMSPRKSSVNSNVNVTMSRKRPRNTLDVMNWKKRHFPRHFSVKRSTTR